MSQLASQIQNIVNLYSEILICIAGAGLFGWIVGMMMQRSRHKRKLAETSAEWKERFQTLEERSRSDAENLEEQLQTMAKETKILQANNRALSMTLKKDEANTQRSHAESVELKRQQAEAQDRLRQIIEKKDSEIAELSNRLALVPSATSRTRTSPERKTSASIARLAPEIGELDTQDADTIALTTARAPDNVLGSLSHPGYSKLQNKPDTTPIRHFPQENDGSLDDTADLSEFGLEESTVAMDEEALAFAQQSFKGQRRD